MKGAVLARRLRLTRIQERLKKKLQERPVPIGEELIRIQMQEGVTENKAREYISLIVKANEWNFELAADGAWMIKK